MLKNTELLQFFTIIIDLLDRKATYDFVIYEKESEIKKLGIERKQTLPEYPKIQYEFSKRKFFGKFYLFICIALIPFIIIDEIYHYYNDVLPIIYGIITLIILVSLIVKEVSKKRKAKNDADEIYYAALDKVLEYNRLDDMRVWKENKQIKQLKEQITQWQHQLDSVNDTITKACSHEDLAQEYCDIKVLVVFSEYLKDGRCETIYECMMKYDEAKRMHELDCEVNSIYRQIENFEQAFEEASRTVKFYMKKRKESIESLCRQQAESMEIIEYNQETTAQSLMLLSLFD